MHIHPKYGSILTSLTSHTAHNDFANSAYMTNKTRYLIISFYAFALILSNHTQSIACQPSKALSAGIAELRSAVTQSLCETPLSSLTGEHCDDMQGILVHGAVLEESLKELERFLNVTHGADAFI
jgi:hypothetical protein